MPFLDRLQRWAEERPDGTAVVAARKRLSWAELRDAAGPVAPVSAVTVLRADNSLASVAGFAAAVAGKGLCAVLDPSWPQQLQDAIAARIAAKFPAGSGGVGTRGGQWGGH